ncbi:hypothetical protein [Streptacidiphilus sp. PAMC 29251]
MESIVQGLEALQSHMKAMQEVLAEARQTAPQRVEGRDHSGSVTVAVGPDGLPDTVTVAAGWQRRIRPSDLGAAVREACGAADEKRLADWAVAFSQVDVPSRLAARQSAAQVVSEGPNLLVGGLGQSRQDPPRALDLVVEDALTVLDTVTGDVAQVPQVPQGGGSDSLGKVSVVLAQHGFVSCEVDEQWAAQAGEGRIGGALNEAFAVERSTT